jgi:hypothetical protein
MRKTLIATALVLSTSAALAGNTDIGGLTYSNSSVTSNSSFYTTLAAGTYSFAFNLATAGKTTLTEAWLSTSGDKYTTGLDDFHVFAVPSGSTSASGTWTETFASATKVFFNVSGNKNKNLGYSDDYTITPVPEPTTTAMFFAGLAALGFMARRRKTL